MKGCEWKSFLQSFWWCKAVIDFQMSVCCLLHSLRMVCMQWVHLLVWHLQHSWRMVWMQWLYKNKSSQTLHCVGVMFKLPHYFFAHISNLHNFRCCGWLNIHSLCILATKENGGFPKKLTYAHTFPVIRDICETHIQEFKNTLELQTFQRSICTVQKLHLV